MLLLSSSARPLVDEEMDGRGPGDVFAGARLAEERAEAVVALARGVLDATVGAEACILRVRPSVRCSSRIGRTVLEGVELPCSTRVSLGSRRRDERDGQQALPSWQPAWPTWMLMTSRIVPAGHGSGLVAREDATARSDRTHLCLCCCWMCWKGVLV